LKNTGLNIWADSLCPTPSPYCFAILRLWLLIVVQSLTQPINQLTRVV